MLDLGDDVLQLTLSTVHFGAGEREGARLQVVGPRGLLHTCPEALIQLSELFKGSSNFFCNLCIF